MKFFGLVLGSALLGALTWAAWLSWGFYPQRSYRTGQVLGCAGTALVLIVLLVWFGRWSKPLVAIALPFTIGLTTAWTIWAQSDDDTGMFAVGSVMMLVGAGVSLSIVEMLARRVFPRPLS